MAYKVFLVDDEVAIREGIRNSKIWQDERFTLVGEAPDGEIALSMIADERPDILLTDVRMPFMDGMQLATEVSRQMPWIQIIIISGYDDFNYARQAMSLGVQEYLLKPISAQDLLDALERTGQRLDRERQRNERQENIRRRLAGTNRFMREKLISTVLSETMNEAEERANMQQLRELGIELNAALYVAEDITWEGNGEDLSVGQDTIYALSERTGGRVYVCAGRHGTLALILGGDELSLEEQAYAFARSVLTELQRIGYEKALVSVGDTVTRLGLAADSAHTARHIRHLCVSGGRYTGFAAVSNKELAEWDIVPSDADVRPLYESLQYAQASEAERILGEYAATLSVKDFHTEMVDSYLRIEVLMTASRILRETGGKITDLPDGLRYEQTLTESDGRLPLDDAVALLRCVLEYRDANRPGKGGGMLPRARAYLAQHYSDPNLMLRDVSEYVGVSDSRFSAVFSQQMGITFTEYLTTLRMNKAKELLSATSLRSSEIALAVGYNDPHYFSYLFRKQTGMTPSEFRRGQREEKSSTETEK